METPNTKVDLRELVVREIARQGFAADLNHINTSRVNDFNDLFYGTGFEGDVSRWDTSNVRSMNGTFSFTKFNGDVSRWDVSKVKDMTAMFGESWFNGDVSRWDVTNVQFFTQMFAGSRFNSELFKIRDVDTRFISGMLEGAPFEKCLKSCGIVELGHVKLALGASYGRYRDIQDAVETKLLLGGVLMNGDIQAAPHKRQPVL